ncbi:MAG: Lrp/AsnC family transcriptional regulator [Nitrosotalea sp.]
MSLDEIDERILAELSKNSRRSYNQLADILGISPNTVLKRIKNMESQGIIKNYSLVVDHKKLGYDVTAIIEITVKEKLAEIEKKLAQIPNIYEVYDITGTSDCIVVASFKNTAELGKFTKQLLNNPSVYRTNTHIVLEKVKEDFRFPL